MFRNSTITNKLYYNKEASMGGAGRLLARIWPIAAHLTGSGDTSPVVCPAPAHRLPMLLLSFDPRFNLHVVYFSTNQQTTPTSELHWRR